MEGTVWKNYTIKDVSELLNIPKSTIRYWDEQGLISTTRNEENGYRTFDLEDLFKIYDIDFYRKMGIPIKDMLNLYKRHLPISMPPWKQQKNNWGKK